jgi:rod shape-determining protein MreD
MSERPASGRGIIFATIFAGLALAVWPLPDFMQAWWPSWAALILIYWGMALPWRVSVGSFWVAGLLLDALKGAVLGEHAIAFTVLALATSRWHLQVRVFPVQQQMLAVGLLLALYQFILFWVRGIAGASQPPLFHIAPVVSSMLAWPFAFLLLRELRRRYKVS